MITRDLRRAIARAAAAAGYRRGEDPGLRPTGIPGQYAASVALTLGAHPRETAGILAAALIREHWVETAEVTGPGYLTVTVTPGALAGVADNISEAGPACVVSEALAGVTVPAPPPGDPLAAPTWEKARAALAARLTARLAAAAGAMVAAMPDTERLLVSRPVETDAGTRETSSRSEGPPGHGAGGTGAVGHGAGGIGAVGHDAGGVANTGASGAGGSCSADPAGSLPGALAGAGQDRTEVARAVAFAGRDAVTFTLARAIPGKPLRIDPEIIARHVPGNPAYAVRYAHARAASGLRWAAASSAEDTIGALEAPEPSVMQDGGGDGGSPPRETAALLDALSWLPERVATAARRGRPDEFARYLEDLARLTVDVLSSASHPGKGAAPESDRLALAKAARAGLAAGLGLLEVSAPDRL